MEVKQLIQPLRLQPPLYLRLLVSQSPIDISKSLQNELERAQQKARAKHPPLHIRTGIKL